MCIRDRTAAIAVAFPRSPAILAYTAWDLQRYSRGRFVLGLGPQVKAHNVLRFGVKWEKPVAKMRETIEAIRAFWHTWQTGAPLDYAGEFFKLMLMTPFFDPGPIDYAPPPIYIAAVNEQMLRLAGSHCDGVHIHALHTTRYLREVALPEIESGLAKSGRTRAGFTINTAVFAIPTDDPAEARAAEAHVRQQLSFYMSTPAYRAVLELHGWQDVAGQLGQMARAGPVSYTHLDVYKRQDMASAMRAESLSFNSMGMGASCQKSWRTVTETTSRL